MDGLTVIKSVDAYVKTVRLRIAAYMVIGSSFLLISCDKKSNTAEVPPYTGPLLESDSVFSVFSDSAIVRVKVRAAKQLEHQNGDQEFPNGVYLEFHNERGMRTSTLKANSARHHKKDKLWKVRGNVIIESTEQHKKLFTEELNWDPTTEKITTSKFVRIETSEHVMTGEGLVANQDFTWYRIEKPIGVFSVNK